MLKYISHLQYPTVFQIHSTKYICMNILYYQYPNHVVRNYRNIPLITRNTFTYDSIVPSYSDGIPHAYYCTHSPNKSPGANPGSHSNTSANNSEIEARAPFSFVTQVHYYCTTIIDNRIHANTYA